MASVQQAKVRVRCPQCGKAVARRARSADAVTRCECGAMFRLREGGSSQMRLEGLNDAIGKLFRTGGS